MSSFQPQSVSVRHNHAQHLSYKVCNDFRPAFPLLDTEIPFLEINGYAAGLCAPVLKPLPRSPSPSPIPLSLQRLHILRQTHRLLPTLPTIYLLCHSAAYVPSTTLVDVRKTEPTNSVHASTAQPPPQTAAASMTSTAFVKTPHFYQSSRNARRQIAMLPIFKVRFIPYITGSVS